MKVALVTTPASVPSGIGDYTRHLLPYLRERCDVTLYVESEEHAGTEDGLAVRPIGELDPRQTDRVLYQIGNERSHAYMARVVRAVGGTVMQHDWVLFDMAVSAYPELQVGGMKGHRLALREGGFDQMRIYARNWMDRRRQRRTPQAPGECLDHANDAATGLLGGWHAAESAGRWTADVACLRLPGDDVVEVEVRLHVDGGRDVRLLDGTAEIARLEGGALRGRVENANRPLLTLETSGIRVSRAQRAHGDSRRLGAFVQGIRWRGAEGTWHEVDLSAAAAEPLVPVTLPRDRFALPLNRSVVRFADSFITHSSYVADRILRSRNAPTPIGVLHHGAERRWRPEDRRTTRRRLGLPEAWVDGFLVTSFGGVQPHKRVDKLIEAVAEARRRRPDVHLVLAGRHSSEEFDAVAHARRLGVADAVRCTGYVEESEGWDWLHAGDVSANLRGPTSGGTSGGIFQSFSLGRAVLASDAAEQKELPDSCTVKVPLGEHEVDAIASELVALSDNPSRRDALEREVRRFVEEECHWSLMGARYAELLESFPRPRAGRKALIALGIERLRESRAG